MALAKNFFLIAGSVFLLDRISKTVFQKVSLDLGFLNLHLVKNSGGLWGVFQGMNILFVFVTLLVLGGIFFYLRRILASPTIVWVSFALVFAGGLGNLIDRLALGFVIDFVDFGFWPAFNVADSAISIAVCLLLFNEFRPFLQRMLLRKKAQK
ncbi:signal peptidase II [Candidatus Woesearchaeota archaeon]|nr:MAG: signal peptidase II [Candidatus Woesearchaeota archaeon]